MPAKYVRWINEGEAGYWTSAEGRFSIDPVYMGRTTAQAYTLRDFLRNKDYKYMNTISDAKFRAESIVANEWRKIRG